MQSTNTTESIEETVARSRVCNFWYTKPIYFRTFLYRTFPFNVGNQ